MTKSDKILTHEYLDWHAKLSGLPSILTNKIQSNLYKKYKKETSLEAMLLQEKTEYSNFKLMGEGGPENKVSYLSFSKQYEEKKPITFKAKPNSELIIKSILEHFLYLKFGNSFRGTDNYIFASPQPGSSPCPICNGKHENYGLHDEWYKNEMEYYLTCFTLSNKFKFTIVA